MTVPETICVDYETHPIAGRPNYPPEPVGVAILWPRREPVYLAWGHPDGNNCTVDDARRELRRVWGSGLPILCHNAKFDLAVSYEQLGLPELPWDRVHDTMFLAYLCDPHARSLGLKPLAEDLLAWPPEERDEVNDWIWAHRTELVAAYGGKVAKSKLGAWIWAAPARLVGTYAVGDVTRTKALFAHLWPIVQREGMGPAYDRERRLLPILMENERIGIRCDVDGLEREIEQYDVALNSAETWLRRELRASGLNFDADRDVAAVLSERGVVPDDKWQTTKTGQRSTSKETLTPDCFTDPRIASALGYRNRLKTCLEMFMKPWHAQGVQRSGYISTNWNQVRGDNGGTRTGRPSTTDPNFLNISKSFEGRSDGYVHPAFLDVPALPLVRKFLLPDEGHVWLHRDFNQQEMRIFADFEQGELWAAYQRDATTNPHAMVGAKIEALTGHALDKTTVKVLNFQALYGGGIPAAQRKLRCTRAEAQEYKAFHDKALPGRRLLNEEITRIVRRGDPIRTWGGRLYYPERPGPDGRDKIYKLINYAIQGSAADLTKQAIVDWYAADARNSRFLVTVYDENNISAPVEHASREMELLRDMMDADRLSVPMRSSGKQGPTWGDLHECA